NRPAQTVGQGLETVFLIALEDLVAGLARNAERATDLAHRFAVQQLSDKPQALVHYRTLLPRHPHLPQKGKGCYPCVRYDLSPMSRAAQRNHRFLSVIDTILVQSAAIGVALTPAAAFAVGLPIAYALQHEWIRV